MQPRLPARLFILAAMALMAPLAKAPPTTPRDAAFISDNAIPIRAMAARVPHSAAPSPATASNPPEESLRLAWSKLAGLPDGQRSACVGPHHSGKGHLGPRRLCPARGQQATSNE